MENILSSATFIAILPFIKSIILLIIGLIVYKTGGKFIHKVLSKTALDPMIFNFITHVFQIVVWVFIAIAILAEFGINSSSIITVIAACGAAVALALQNSLSNLASGVLIMSTRPFRKGDYIVCSNVCGTVESIDLLFTEITTDEGRKTTIPNSLLTSGTITNYTKNGSRRYEILIGVAYDTDIDLARKVLYDIVANDPRTMKDPAPGCDVTQYADSAIVLKLRSWAKSEDFLRYSCDMNNQVKPALDKANISIPFPQVDVHMDK